MSGEANIERDVCELEMRLHRPEVRTAPEEVAALLDDEFIEFGASGRTYDKSDVVGHLQSEEPRGEPALHDLNAKRLAPGVVLVTYRLVESGGSAVPVVESLRSSIWRLRDDRWQMVFHQGTPR